MKKLFLLLIFTSIAFGQTHTFPFQDSGTSVAMPTSCSGPSFYFATDTGNLFVCNAANGSTGIFTSVTSSTSGSATVSLNPNGLTFGTVQASTSTPPSLPATISNTNAASVNVTGISITGSDFTEVSPGACLGPLPGFSSCTFLVQSAPTSVGVKASVATVSTTAPVDSQNPLTIALNATGTGSATFPITITPLGLGVGATTDGGSLACPTTCILNYPVGTVVTLTATPNTGSSFGGFGGAGLTTISPTSSSFTVTQAQTITSTFNLTPVDANLTLRSTGQGSGTLTGDTNADNGLGSLSCRAVAGTTSSTGGTGCSGPFPVGTVINVTAATDSNSTFLGWSGFPGCTTTICQVTLAVDTTLTANYSLNSSNVQLSFIQATANGNVSGTTISNVWAAAQLAGDLNVCAITVPDNTTTISGVTDTGGNTYTHVALGTETTTGLSQRVYYAQAITAAGAGARTTTATLSTSAASAVGSTSLFSNHDLATANSYASTSITLPNNQEILVATWAQLNSGNGPGPVTSITDTAGGLTWTLVLANDFNTTQGTGTTTREEVWRSVGTGATGVITAHWGTSPAGHAMGISAWSGADITGAGANAIGITAKNTGTGTAASVTMGTFGAASSGTYAAFATGSSKARTAGAGMTILGADQLQSDEWAAGNIPTPAETLSTSVSWGGIAIEIKASGGSGRRDMRCDEYAGVKQSGNPVEAFNSAAGSSTTPASGTVTSAAPGDLITGFTASLSSVNTPAASFTQQIKNSFGDDIEDRQGVAAGTYNFQPTLLASANWLADNIAWLPQSTTAPTVFSLNLSGGTGNGTGRVTSNTGTPPINGAISTGNCASACSSQVSSGSTVTLTAVPDPGSVFDRWTGITGCASSAVCTVPNITANQNANASFTQSGAQQLYVATTGSNSNSGLSPSTPVQTIATAISRATSTSGTTINVAAGTYGELRTGCSGRTANMCVDKSGPSTTNRLKIQCSTPFSVPSASGCLLRNLSGNGGITIAANNVDVIGFDYTNPGQVVGLIIICQGNPTSGACTTGNSVHVSGNYLHDIAQTANDGAAGGTGCPSFGAIYAGSTQHGTAFQTDVQIIGNRISNYGDQSKAQRNGGSCNLTHGIYSNTPNVIIENNLVIQAAAYNVQLYNQACNSVISNNTLDQPGKGAIVIANGTCGVGATGRVTINNNILEAGTGGAITLGTGGGSPCTGGSRVQISKNLVPAGTAITTGNLNGCTDISGTVNEAPASTFAAYTPGSLNNSYVLKSTSLGVNGASFTPCASGGITPCAPSTDFLGIARPQRANPDIGAYELP